MGRCVATYKKILFDLSDPELTKVYVAIQADGDCPLSVQGWHHKTFPASMSCLDILAGIKDNTIENPLLWGLEAPN